MHKNRPPVETHDSALRGYARALLGSDAAAQRVLTGARGSDFAGLPPRDVRVRLFRLFHDRLQEEEGSRRQADDALMLRFVQGFSIQEVATILRGDALDLSVALESAFADLHRQDRRDVLLVQEDPVLASGMTETIESLGHRVLGVARDEGEALMTAKSIHLDAVVADLSDRWTAGGALPDAGERLGEIAAPVIFVTPAVEFDDGRPYQIATPFQNAELKVMLSQALRNEAIPAKQ